MCQMSSQLQPDSHTDLVLDEGQSDFLEELWDGEKVMDIKNMIQTIFYSFSCFSSVVTIALGWSKQLRQLSLLNAGKSGQYLLGEY
jgi:hypothetical protein